MVLGVDLAGGRAAGSLDTPGRIPFCSFRTTECISEIGFATD